MIQKNLYRVSFTIRITKMIKKGIVPTFKVFCAGRKQEDLPFGWYDGKWTLKEFNNCAHAKDNKDILKNIEVAINHFLVTEMDQIRAFSIVLPIIICLLILPCFLAI